KKTEYIQARKSQLNFYREIPLYIKRDKNTFVLYKQKGITIDDMRISENTYPSVLYIKSSDKIKGIQEAQKAFNKKIENDIKSDNPEKVKETLVNMVNETLDEPRSGSLEGVYDTVDILVSDYSKEHDIIKNLIDISHKDYSTTLHSISVMALALGFASYINLSQDETRLLGLCGLLHDVGKTKIDPEILIAQRKLTEEEFEKIKSHTYRGYYILRECKFKSEYIKQLSLCALEHHEKLDGTGYPLNKTENQLAKFSQILAIIDCYEALTNDDRPYRSAMSPFDALNEIIGRDVKSGKYNKEIFTLFIQSLSTAVK
ncbi:MAG: HD domain-containing protein, partial [Deltaproteobacteria bacterium]|nr:HD domain-containing protein [Deltaproteobacteria bacterium]